MFLWRFGFSASGFGSFVWYDPLAPLWLRIGRPVLENEEPRRANGGFLKTQILEFARNLFLDQTFRKSPEIASHGTRHCTFHAQWGDKWAVCGSRAWQRGNEGILFSGLFCSWEVFMEVSLLEKAWLAELLGSVQGSASVEILPSRAGRAGFRRWVFCRILFVLCFWKSREFWRLPETGFRELVDHGWVGL